MKKFVAFIILLTFVIALLTACSGSSQGIGETGISAREFDNLYLGMTNQKVDEIIGGYGELISEAKDEDENYYVYKRLYRYTGEKSGYAELEFTHKVSKDYFHSLDNMFSSTLSSKTKYDLE